MADEDLSLNEDQLLDNLDDANGDLLNDVSCNVVEPQFSLLIIRVNFFRRNPACK